MERLRKLIKDVLSTPPERFKVIDTKTGEIIDNDLPKKIAQKLAAKKNEWISYPDKKESTIAKIAKTLDESTKKDCNCGCHSCENVGNPGVVLNESLVKKDILSENLRYHVDKQLPLTENTFRYGSEAFLNLWAEARSLYLREIIHVNDDDKEILTETDLGNFGLYEGVKVPLDLPMAYENQYEPILEDIAIYGTIYEAVNIENSYKIDAIESDGVSNNFIFIDKHGIKRKLQFIKGNSVKLLWFDPKSQEWTTERMPSKYEDEKVMNTFGMILVKVILPKYGSFYFKALSEARYRLFRALIYNNLDISKYEMDYDDEARTIEVHKIDTLTEEGKKKNPPLNKPKRGGSKKFYVYVRNPKTKKIKKVSFGDTTGLSVKINDPKARQAFAKRHKCAQATDRTKARYWSCRIGRYWKQLGGSKNFSGFW